MSDFDLAALPDLLARLSVAAVIRVADDGSPIISRDEVRELCKECAAAIRALMAERERLSALVYVPGLWRCPKCEFRMIATFLDAGTGRVAANNEPGEKCPNCHGPLWRVTERDAGNEIIDRQDKAIENVIAAEREACAKVCDDYRKEIETPPRISVGRSQSYYRAMAEGAAGCAAAIRARGEP